MSRAASNPQYLIVMLVILRDTVCSVGLFPKTLPFVSSNRAIKTFRHALSLDEHRAKFKANHYNRPTEHEKTLGTRPGEMPRSRVHIPASPNFLKGKAGSDADRGGVDDGAERDDGQEETDVLEVWFAGCHCGTLPAF